MTGFILILQTPPTDSANSYALETLNQLGLAVFLVGIGLLILMSAHYYRMRESGKSAGSRRKKRDTNDPLTHLGHMSKEELRMLALKEKEKADGAAESEGTSTDSSPHQLSLPGLQPSASTASGTEDQTGAGAQNEGAADNEESERFSLSEQTELIARLLLPAEDSEAQETDPIETKKPANVKNPYTDSVKRSPLSNELPDEFRSGKSRKI